MGWASKYIADLEEGKSVEFRPYGSSMSPLIESGQLVVLAPVGDNTDLSVGDIVLCRVGIKEYLHLIKDILHNGWEKRYQIGNNHGRINGHVGRRSVFGKLVKVVADDDDDNNDKEETNG